MPIWDPAQNPSRPAGNPCAIAIDPRHTNLPPDETADVIYNNQTKHVHVVGAGKIHLFAINAQQAADINSNPTLSAVAQAALGRPLQQGDFAAPFYPSQ